jgi:hypothetical protein
MSNPRSIFTSKELGTLHNQPSLKATERRLSTPEYEALSNAGLTAQKPAFASPSNIRAWNGHSQQNPPSSKASRTGTVDTATSTARLAGRKRSTASNNTFPHPHSEPLHKRRRLHHILRHPLDRSDIPTGFYNNSQPPSPLFFSSNTQRSTPQLPPRFSSGEAGARMLSKAHAEESSIKTVTLARGSYSGSSPLGLAGASNRASTERGSIPQTSSPEVIRSFSLSHCGGHFSLTFNCNCDG